MRYFSEKDGFVNAECEHCKMILKIMQANPTGFSLNQPGGVRCSCGTVHHSIVGTTMVCPHCQTRSSVTTKNVKRKKGISGAKATGLSRKEEETEAHCNACGATWHYS